MTKKDRKLFADEIFKETLAEFHSDTEKCQVIRALVRVCSNVFSEDNHNFSHDKFEADCYKRGLHYEE